jgi:hypothetical protein
MASQTAAFKLPRKPQALRPAGVTVTGPGDRDGRRPGDNAGPGQPGTKRVGGPANLALAKMRYPGSAAAAPTVESDSESLRLAVNFKLDSGSKSGRGPCLPRRRSDRYRFAAAAAGGQTDSESGGSGPAAAPGWQRRSGRAGLTAAPLRHAGGPLTMAVAAPSDLPPPTMT